MNFVVVVTYSTNDLKIGESLPAKSVGLRIANFHLKEILWLVVDVCVLVLGPWRRVYDVADGLELVGYDGLRCAIIS